jgi:hypothetical protein
MTTASHDALAHVLFDYASTPNFFDFPLRNPLKFLPTFEQGKFDQNLGAVRIVSKMVPARRASNSKVFASDANWSQYSSRSCLEPSAKRTRAL